MNSKMRIELTDSGMDIIVKMAEGNPGAVRVLCEMLKDGGAIDPDNSFGGLGALLSLDTFGIYGSRIWVLYKDICGEDLTSTLGIMRAVQLGFLSETTLARALDIGASGVDVADLLRQVRARFPSFGTVSA